MLRLKNLSQMFQKRTIRVLYSNTLAHPYAGTLDPALRNTDLSIRPPVSTDTTPFAYTVNTFTYQSGTMPAGLVMVKSGAGEAFLPANGANPGSAGAGPYAFGFLANNVGGNLDDLGDNNEIGVWVGFDSVYELLYPAFNDTGLAAAYAAATAGVPVPLYAGFDGRLCCLNSGTSGLNNSLGNRAPVADLIERRSASVIVIKSRV